MSNPAVTLTESKGSEMRSRPSRPFVAVAIAVVVIIAGLVAFLSPGSASAGARSSVRAFGAAPIAQALRDGISASASRAGLPPSALLEVAAKGQSVDRAGVFVGSSKAGDVVAFFTPTTFTEFKGANELTSSQPIQISASLQPDAQGATGHVQLQGVATSAVAKATLTLADGSTLPVELVSPNNQFSYFTYVSDDPNTFPTNLQAFASDGSSIYTHDLRRDIAAPSPS